MFKIKTYKNYSLAITVVLLLALPLYILIDFLLIGENIEKSKKADFVGRETCIECHQEEYFQWKGSHHDKAMDIATDSTVLGNFENLEIENNSRIHKFYKKMMNFISIPMAKKERWKSLKLVMFLVSLLCNNI